MTIIPNARGQYQINAYDFRDHKLTLKEQGFMGMIHTTHLLKSFGYLQCHHLLIYIIKAAHWIRLKDGGHGASRRIYKTLILALNGSVSVP